MKYIALGENLVTNIAHAILPIRLLPCAVYSIQTVGSALSKTCYTHVTAFMKMCIVHTSDYTNLRSHKIQSECYTGLKFARLIKE